ncbi:MAG: hypothetical protein ISQ08_01745 [Planctomycetes bacterium]|nr:hypothetical protein [Planctomycetota bacterium]
MSGGAAGAQEARPSGLGSRLLALVVLGALVGGALWSSGRDESPALSPRERLLGDPRVRRLTDDCGIGFAFNEDTSDLIPVLVSKLEMGMLEPLQMATRELARIGAPAVPELQRLYDRAAATEFLQGVVKNVVEVCALMEDPAGLEILRSTMNHASEPLRLAAADGMSRHGLPEDYERVLGWVRGASSPAARVTYAKALRAMDSERFVLDLLEWLEKGHLADLYPQVADVACEVGPGELPARLAAAAGFHDVTPAARLYLIAPAARDGDPLLLEELLAAAQGEHPGRAAIALDALARIGSAEVLEEVLTHDLRIEVRLSVLGSVERLEDPELALRLLRLGLQDPQPRVREVALQALVARGDGEARSRALALLRGTQAEREQGMDALRLAWPANPGAAEEAFELLAPLLRGARDRSQRIALMQSLSHIPTAEAADLLWAQISEFQGEVKGVTPHRFVCGLSWNTGEPGRQRLRSRLGEELDPLRRLDLIEWIWQDRSEASREVLMEALLQPREGLDAGARPLEVLYLADRLAVMGPAEVVAPRIEWAYKESTDPVARPALQCMLWQWFGDQRFMRE